MLPVPFLLLLLAQQPITCATVEVCRAEALIAHARGDFETFHDLAWAAYRKGKSDDPALMLLVARAQALSGRPGDALVMLERIAAIGAPTDAATSEDFVKVRALPRWGEVEAKLSPAAADKPPAKAPASASAKATADKPSAKAPASASAKATADKPPAKDPAPSASVPAPSAKDPAPSASVPAPSAKAPAPSAKAPAPSAKTPAPPAKAGLRFSTLLTPTALVYDAVSKRFIIADREARRLAVIDENSGQVATLVGELGALGDVGGIAIDPQQGDLWVVSSDSDGATLHKMQLISGRVLSTVALKGPAPGVVAMAFVRGVGLVVADNSGIVWRVPPSGRGEKLGALEYVPRALASDGNGRLYIAGGAPRLARVSVLGSSLRKTGVVELEDGIPADAPFAVTGNRLLVVVRTEGEYELRRMPLK